MSRRARATKATKVTDENIESAVQNGRQHATELLPPAVSKDVIDEVVDELNDLARSAALDLAFKMGELIIDNFFDSEIDAWTTRGTRDASMRKLAEHPRLSVSASTVHRSVHGYAIWVRMGKPDWKHLSITHLRALFRLNEDDQQRLLTQAEDKEWTVDKVQTEAGKLRDKIADGRGRPPLPAFVKSWNRIGKYLIDPDESFGDLDRLDELADEQAIALFKTATEMKARCDELQKQLQKRVKALKP